jgi:hypothetical protein
MTYFPEIIRILDRFREPRIETLDGEFRTSTAEKSFQLYDGIRSGKFATDHIAAHELYEANPTDQKYSTLKSRLKWRLLNTLFHLNLKKAGFSEFAVASYVVNRRAFLVQTLVTLGARYAGIKLADKTLRDALHYEFTSVALNTAILLRTHASLTSSKGAYEKFDGIVKDHLQMIQAEAESWEYYERAQSVVASKANPGEGFQIELAEHIQTLGRWLGRISTVTFMTNYYRLKFMYAKVARDNEEALSVTEEAVQFLRAKPHLVSPARLAEFSLGRLEAYSAMQNYSKAIEAARECATLFGKGSNNWFALREREFKLLMLSQKFVEAQDLYDEVTQHPRFVALTAISHEQWKVLDLYLQFALQTVPEAESLPIRKKFDLQAFLRFIPVASKDKHGTYVAVLIIHILYMLESGDFNGIIDRMDALRTYRSRYLRGKTNRRSALFFRMLTVMENNSFNYTLTRQKTERLYKQLKATALETPESNEEIQIIPYEWLWDRVLAKLEEYEGSTVRN